MTEPRPEKGLPPAWVVFEACPKCGCTIPGVKYRAGQCFPFDTNEEVKAPHRGEHFHARCWRCGFGWVAGMEGKRL